jgi:hypothetical protein
VSNQADGVTITVSTPTVVPVGGNPNYPSAIIGTGSWGTPGVPYLSGNILQVKDATGDISLNLHDIATCSALYFLGAQSMGSSGNGLYVIRETDTTDTAAVITVKDTVTPTAGNVLVITAKCTGTRGNGAINATTNAVTGAYLTISQAATWTLTLPVYNIALSIPNAPSVETFSNIVANNGTAYSATTFVANAIAAINTGQSYLRGPSSYWVASAPTTQSTIAPLNSSVLTATFVGAGGTDGASGVTSAQLLGVNTLASRTGIYAEQGLGVGQLTIAGYTDFATCATATSYASSGYKVFVGPNFSLGTALNVQSAVSAKNANNTSSIFQALPLGWLNWSDPVNGYARWVSPEGFILGMMSSQSPEQSLGNQPVNGMNGYINATERSQNPFSDAELALLRNSGIIPIGALRRNRALIGTLNGQNASAIPGQDGTNYTRLTGYLKKTITNIAGVYVDALQSTAANDITRRKLSNDLNSFLQSLQANNQINSYQVTCNLTNNSIASIQAGNLNASVYVEYLATACFINVNLVAGTSVTVTAGPTTPNTA